MFNAVARSVLGGARPVSYAGAVHLGLITVVVSEYDPAISFFVDGLGFELVEDSPALTNDGRPKRWVVVRPPGAATGLLLARADGEDQAAAVGKQAAGRVGFFLQVEDFHVAYRAEQGLAGAGINIEFPPAGGLFDRDMDADAGAVVTGVGEGGQIGRGGGVAERGQGVAAG